MELKTQMENPGKVSLIAGVLKSSTPEQIVIKIRKPSWSAGRYSVCVNGEANQAYTEEDGYIQITLEAGMEEQRIDVEFNCTFHIEATPDCPDIVSLFYGPYILAALSGETELIELPGDEERITELAIRQDEGLSFSLEGRIWIPFCFVDKECYHLFFKKSGRR